jgi:glycosyltransferase involved in cell wall biosynthesis
MKILFAHSAYQHRGGEDVVVDAEIALLRQCGNTVHEYRRHNDEIALGNRVGVALDTFWSRRTASEIGDLIAKVRPDVIHCHNTFPLISPSLYWAAARAGVPVVQTLHNFRLLCPQAMMLREGKVCEDCLGKLPWRGAVRGCYRDSRLQSTVQAGMTTLHRALGTWQHKVTRYIALNHFCRDKLIAGGLPAAKIMVKPNFVDWPSSRAAASSAQVRQGFLFVGRLSTEKGLAVMAQAAVLVGAGLVLRVAGTGPQSAALDGITNVLPLGGLSGNAVRQEMECALALVMPSIWYETFGLVIIEAFACGLPVIASRLGAMAELVVDGETGLLFNPGDATDLADKLRWAQANPAEMARMGANAQRRYQAEFTAERNYQQLMAIYQDAIAAQGTTEVFGR